VEMQQDASEGWQQRLPTVKLQAEYFLLKFPDVGRDRVEEMAEAFKKFDSRRKGELQEDEALRLLEARKETKRFVELRQMVEGLVYDRRREFSFLEWACAYFGKSWKVLHQASINQAEIDRAIARVREAEERRIRVEQEEERRLAEEKRKEEEERRRRAEETSRAGVKGAAAKFDWTAKDVSTDQTMTNEQRIKAEAAARREKKKAEQDRLAAEEEKRRAEAAAREAAEAEKRRQEEIKRKAEEEERIAAQKEAERKARIQAKLRAQFGGK